MSLIFALVLGLVAFEGLGYGLHRVMHCRWAGPLWRSHLEHHRLYPPRDLTSAAYRDAGAHNTAWRFLAASLALAGLMLWVLPWGHALALIAELGAVGVANDRVHEVLHLEGHWLGRTRWAARLRERHAVHHRDVRRNLGIWTGWWDKIMGTN